MSTLEGNTIEKEFDFEANMSNPIENNQREEASSTLATSSRPPNPGPGKRKSTKPASNVWPHFNRQDDDPENHKAKCKYCGASYACYPKRHGTNNLKNHIATCKKYPYKVPPRGQTILSFQSKTIEGSSGSSTSLVATTYSEKRCRELLARMIIKDELPFSFVEKEGFREYSEGVEPRFILPSRITVAKDCMNLYLKEKQKLKAFFAKTCQRVSLTTDCWRSGQNLDYMVLTAHYVDSEWKLQKRILIFCQIESHKGEIIGKKIEKCLLDWGIDRVFTITVDNASSNDTAVSYLTKKIKNWNGLVLDGEFLHVRCCAHILNLVVSDGLKIHEEAITRIRNIVLYVRSSPARLQKFKTCAEEEKFSTTRLVCLDVSTRWNSTYLMLDAALRFQKAFERLQEQESGDFNEEDYPSTLDWAKAKVFLCFLKYFYEITLKFSGSLFITSNKYFPEIFFIHKLIAAHITSNDPMLSAFACKMKSKFDKYWGNVERTNFLLYVAVVLDPRYKLTILCASFKNMYGDELGDLLTKKVEAILRRLFDAFKGIESNNYGGENDDMGQSSQSVEVEQMEGVLTFKQLSRQWTDQDDVDNRSEVDSYLLEKRVIGNDSLDVLNWWNENFNRFKTLSQVAKYVLAVPVSTVASESAFSTGERLLDPYRSSLNPKTVEALVCAQNWLRSSPVPIDIQQTIDEINEQDLFNFDEELIVYDQ